MLRADQKIIAEVIEQGSKVIDIGCGQGSLLEYLEAEKGVSGHGLEIEADRVSAAVSKGLSVVQGDADNDLQYYSDKGFDYAILGQTLQIMKHPKEALEQALRVAKRVVVVIPNFGYIQNRFYLLIKGRMPVTKELSYQWYETPNIHFCTIKDFVYLAKELGCNVERKSYVSKCGKEHKFSGDGTFASNLFGEYGIFVLSKD